ncbi:helix-turn-helix domain-containing protein [Pseudomonas sp. CGJS7]|uniref:helix-turn-helix domain-containing protein n=1 Tax=Pseudomonas sp. CGJS7 TaxID=3109348 RepID=UPI003008CC53
MTPAHSLSSALKAPAARSSARDVGVGALLREWRSARRLSQLDLALDAGVSARHLSYLETGKSHASREMIARLADALEMPLRERNALLVAAGFAPMYPETALATPELAQIRRAIEFVLKQQEPYPAFLLNRHWDVVMANQAAVRVNRFVMDGRPNRHSNMIRQIFDPEDLRPAVANWEEIAGELIRHLHNAVAAAPSDTVARNLLAEALAYPGVPAHWRRRQFDTAPSPLLPTILRHGDSELRFFSTITTFGTPRDITLDELHVECCFPMDEATAQLCRELAAQDAAVPASA